MQPFSISHGKWLGCVINQNIVAWFSSFSQILTLLPFFPCFLLIRYGAVGGIYDNMEHLSIWSTTDKHYLHDRI